MMIMLMENWPLISFEIWAHQGFLAVEHVRKGVFYDLAKSLKLSFLLCRYEIWLIGEYFIE